MKIPVKDIAIILAITILSTVIIKISGIFQTFQEWMRKQQIWIAWQAHDYVFILIVLLFICSIYVLKNWITLNREISKRKQIEKEFLFKAHLLDNVSDSVFVIDFEGNFIFFNETAYKSRGYTKDELMSMNLRELDDPKFIPLIAKRFKEIIDKGSAVFESAHLRKDGSSMPIEVHSRLYELGDKKVFLSVIRDITERETTQQALNESEEHYKRLFENNPVGIYRTTSDGKILMANPALYKMLGYGSFNDYSSRNLDKNPTHQQYSRQEFKKRLQRDGKIIGLESVWKTKDGRDIYVRENVKSFFNPGTKETYYEGTVEDITGLKQAEKEHEKSYGFNKLLLQTIPFGMDIVDKEGNVLFINDNLNEHFNNEAIGKKCWILYKDDKTQCQGCPLLSGLEDGVTKVLETSEVMNGKTFEISHTPIDFKGKKAVLEIFKDITERKQAEKKLKDSLKEKETLLKEVHHRVKNNLQIIWSLIKLQSNNISDPRLLEIFGSVGSRVKSMALIHQTMYKSENFSKIDMKEYLNSYKDYIQQIYSNKNSQVNLILNIEKIHLNMETAIPCGLLINELLTNSYKHAFPQNKKGTIEINFSSNGNGKFKLKFKDEGIGFPSGIDIQNSNSTGLTLIHALTDQIDGTIEVKNECGVEYNIVFPDSVYKKEHVN
ncbi:MAG TPA: PAS domain S-box protein [Ignavibacteria bacterium]|jgi:PAS domain S-box-containing protein